ncbi:hypothetical protein HPB51_001947 [Rhipicephalus microplus]|uniref:Sulfotransferase domain-containing protein n=1 Tax=Rhipicephalus microplus TaxID=6941 RepID=A0A9J6DXU3_RHIMP|nr:hypothetical protein HPB51_001947 [Rhipicephalus microplus]
MCKTVDGFLINDFLHDDNVRSALNYVARPDDIFVVHIRHSESLRLLRFVLPPRARFACLQLRRRDARRIVDVFVEGKVSCGDYFDHLISWYVHRNDENVLFITYERLKEDIAGSVLQIADFLGKQHGEELRRDAALFAKITDMVSALSMRQAFSSGIKAVMPNLLSLPPEKALKSVEVYRGVLRKKRMSTVKSEFIRKGVVGDWRNHLQEKHIEKIKHWIALKTQDSDVMKLWGNAGLP